MSSAPIEELLSEIICLHTYYVYHIHKYCTQVPVAESSIQVLSNECAKPIEQLLENFGDVVTLRGQPYAGDISGGNFQTSQLKLLKSAALYETCCVEFKRALTLENLNQHPWRKC